MIALGTKCLLFETPGGEAVPLSSDMITIEMAGDAAKLFEADFVDNAASAVFHYFKHELGRESVTVAEFAEKLEKALKSVGGNAFDPVPRPRLSMEYDLRKLAQECGVGCELVFFPRLRTELRELMKGAPQTVKFSGLRDCVKELMGARRWTSECRVLKDQIVSYLRECLCAESTAKELSLFVE